MPWLCRSEHFNDPDRYKLDPCCRLCVTCCGRLVEAYSAGVQLLIRPYAPKDAVAIAELMYRSVREVAIRDYSMEQVEAWLPEPPDPTQIAKRAADGRWTLVACRGKHVIGYADLEPDGHIDHLFCAPSAVGHGVGGRLYDALERLARDHHLDRLYVEASELAWPLFRKRGFRGERQDLELNGVQIHNYVMCKALHDG